jgi:hypothetical protein
MTRRQVKNIMSLQSITAQKHLSSGRMPYWTPNSFHKPLWHYQRSHRRLRTSGQHFYNPNPHCTIPWIHHYKNTTLIDKMEATGYLLWRRSLSETPWCRRTRQGLGRTAQRSNVRTRAAYTSATGNVRGTRLFHRLMTNTDIRYGCTRPLSYPIDTATFATRSINGMESATRVTMLKLFTRVHDLDILLLQEVTQALTLGLPCYQAQYNIGTNRWGTAIIVCYTITITNIDELHSGRAIAATLVILLLVNIYAPSCSAKRLDGERDISITVFLVSLGHILTTYAWAAISTVCLVQPTRPDRALPGAPSRRSYKGTRFHASD